MNAALDACTEVVPGVSVTVAGLYRLTCTEANFVASAWEVAVTVSVAVALGILTLGAVYTPVVAFTVPQGFPPQPPPEMLHVTAKFDGPVTVAVNGIC